MARPLSDTGDADRSTRGRVIARYASINRRDDLTDAHVAVVWAALDRTLRPLLPPDRSARCLDVACGEGLLMRYLHAHGFGDVRGIDLSPESIDLCRRSGLDARLGDARDLPSLAGDGQVDLLTAYDLVEHLPKEAAATFLEDIGRALRPGGVAVLQTPNLGSVTGAFHRYDDLTHEFGLTEKSALDLAMAAGFAADDVTVAPAWSATTALGRAREAYARLLHHAVSAVDGAERARIASRNLLIVLRKRSSDGR